MKLLHLKPIIFNFGCPRSGTTFIEEAFSYIPIHTQKIAEGNPLHPCISDSGLIALQDLYKNRKVVFVRTFRDPGEIFESFRAMDGSIGKQDNKQIYLFIQSENHNFHKQKKEIKFIEIDFDKLKSEEYRVDISTRIGREVGICSHFLNALNKYGHNPIRKGRLSMGITKSSLTAKEIDNIKRWSRILK